MEENDQAPAPIDIKDLRRRLGGGTDDTAISQAALAAKLQVHQATVSRMENDPALQRGPLALLLRQLDADTPEPAGATSERRPVARSA